MTRRKAQPLLPHEVISNIHSSQADFDVTPASSFSTTVNSEQGDPSSQESVGTSQTTADTHSWELPHQRVVNTRAEGPEVVEIQTPISGSTAKTRENEDGSSDILQSTKMLAHSNACTKEFQDQPPHLMRSLSHTLPTKRRPGYLANRRSAPFMIHDESSAAPSSNSISIGKHGPDRSSVTSPHSLKRTPSIVRLSLSLEGKAEVTTRTGNTPSPPRSQPTPASGGSPRPKAGFQRSYSAVELTCRSEQRTSLAPFPRRPATGRSRDSRTWEFYCDSDARNALTEQAEREERGSATAAISLIRSCNQNKKVMTPNLNKRNANDQKPTCTKRLKAGGQNDTKPKLARATSSIARLQTTTTIAQRHEQGTVGHKETKSGSGTDIFQDPDCDSDKENWQPGTRTSNPRRRRPGNSQLPGRILKENMRIPSHSTSHDAVMQQKNPVAARSSLKSSSDEEKENFRVSAGDFDATAFANESAPREVEDLDCVQNLLSLSQAAWQPA